MAKIAPKGKKVLGTKKKDKITWVSTKPWKKNLTVKAGSGNDVINFKKSKYKNTIYGEAGADKIYGGKGADKIYGGKGNDTIQAGKGSNTLYFSKGDGTDTVLKGGGTDTLVFKTEKSLAGLKVAYSGNNAIITYNGGKVVLKDYKLGGHSAKYVKVGSAKKTIADLLKPPLPIVDGYYVINGTSGNDSITAKDGYDCKISGGAGNDTITGGAGNDQIYGGAGNDEINAGVGNNTIYIGKNEGTDIIQDGGGTDTLVFSGATGLRDLSFVYDGYDLTISVANANAVLINQMIFGSSVKYIKVGNEIIELPTGVTISSDSRLQINTSTRNEFVFGTYEGDDIQYIYTGSGNDTIFTTQNSSSTISAGVGDDLIIGSDGNGQYAYWLDAGNDTIYVGKSGAIDINPSLGNDVIYTAPTSENTGETNYLFDYIFGHDTIYWRGNTENRMAFDETEYEDIRLLKNPNNDDLIIACSTQNSVTLKDYFKAGNEGMATSFKLKGVDEVPFKEVGAVLAEKGLTDYARGTDGNDIINMEQDGYWVDGLTGDDAINAYKLFDTAYGGISNTISGGEGNDVITAGVGNDIVDGGEGNDTIAGIRGANTLMGGTGNDEINGGTGADTIYGGDGNDSITTGSGDVADYVDASAGNDTIQAYQGGSNTLLGGEGDDSIFGCNGSETIEGGDGNDSIDGAGGNDSINGGWGNDTIYGNGTIKGGRGNDKLCGGNGDDFLYAEYGDNTLRGGIGDNKFYSGEGSDTFEFANYSGRNTIYGATSSDKIVFSENYYKHEINKDGNDLIINYWDNERYPLNYTKIRIDGYFSADDKIDTITYKDDEDVVHTIKINEQIITGSGTINGTMSDDIIVANSGDDFIYAGRGNDEIHAGSGNNTMVFYNRYYFDGSNKYDNANDGNDIVYTNGGGVDTLDFGQSIAVKYEKSDNDLIIKYNFDPASNWEAKSTVTLKDFYDSTVNNSTQYIKLLGQDAIELKPDELTQDAITTHNGSILCSSNSSDMTFNDNNNYYTAFGGNNSTYIDVYTNSGTYYFDGIKGEYDVYSMNSLDPKVIIYDSDNIGIVNIYTGSFTNNNNIFCDMQVTVEDHVVTACDYNSLNIYRTGQFDQGVRVMASPNLAGVTDGTPAQSISRVVDGNNSKMLTDISGLAQATASWIATNKETGVYSTADLVSAGGDDASAILAIANTYWHT